MMRIITAIKMNTNYYWDKLNEYVDKMDFIDDNSETDIDSEFFQLFLFAMMMQ